MLGLEKKWVEKVKQHKAYEFWSGILTVHPKKIIGQTYRFHSKHMETPEGVYLTNWLTFVYVHGDGHACLLSTNPAKVNEMLTKSLSIIEGTNIVVDNNTEVCSLIGRLASTDEDGNVTLVNTNTVFFPIIDNLFQNIFDIKVVDPFKKEEFVALEGTVKEKKKSLIPPEVMPLLSGDMYLKDRVIQMKKNRKGKAAIAKKLNITLETVERYLK